MKKVFIALMMFMSLNVSAENSSREISFPKESLVEGLKDCRFFIVKMDGSLFDGSLFDRSIYVVRCPNSSTGVTYPQGKQQVNVQVSEGLNK